MKRALILAAVLALAGCEQKNPGATADTASATAPATASASASATASAPATASASASASASWSGSYNAKVGKIDLPKDLNQPRAADDGKSAIGPGNLTLSIASDGEINGTIDGALGKGTITGRLESDSLRASIFPNEQGPASMAGVVMGTLAGDAIKGDIRVSGPDATVVREASFELKKK